MLIKRFQNIHIFLVLNSKIPSLILTIARDESETDPDVMVVYRLVLGLNVYIKMEQKNIADNKMKMNSILINTVHTELKNVEVKAKKSKAVLSHQNAVA